MASILSSSNQQIVKDLFLCLIFGWNLISWFNIGTPLSKEEQGQEARFNFADKDTLNSISVYFYIWTLSRLLENLFLFSSSNFLGYLLRREIFRLLRGQIRLIKFVQPQNWKLTKYDTRRSYYKKTMNVKTILVQTFAQVFEQISFANLVFR